MKFWTLRSFSAAIAALNAKLDSLSAIGRAARVARTGLSSIKNIKGAFPLLGILALGAALPMQALAVENWQKVVRLTPTDELTYADTLIFEVTFVNAHIVAPTASDFTVTGNSTATVTDVSVDPNNSSIYQVTVSGGNLASYNGIVGLLPASNRIRPETLEYYFVSNGTELPASDRLVVFDYANETSELGNGYFGVTPEDARANADALCKSSFLRNYPRAVRNQTDANEEHDVFHEENSTSVDNGPVKARAVISFSASDDIASLANNYSIPDLPVYNSGGTKMADAGWADFVDGTLSALNSNASNMLENSGNVKYFWSFSDSGGTFNAANNCSGGTSPSNAVKGVANQNGSWYTLIGSVPCNNALNFICVAWHESGELEPPATNDAPAFSGLDGAPSYTEDGAAVVMDVDVTVSDTELDALSGGVGDYNNATLTIERNGGANAEDVFSNTAPLSSLTEGQTLSFDSTEVGAITTNSGGSLVLTFNQSATTSLVNSVLQNIAYANTSNTPPASAVLDWVFNDGEADSTGTNQVTVSITATNDAPEISSTAVTAGTEDTAYSYSLAASDPENQSITWSVKDGTSLPSWLTLNASTEAVVSTLAGSSSGLTNASGIEAQFKSPYDVATDAAGNVYVADYSNHVIRKVTPEGVVTTLAGSGTAGSDDGTGAAASFSFPKAVAVDSSGNVLVADSSNNKIRKITPAGVVTTLAGTGSYGTTDGNAAAATFAAPTGIAIDSNDNIFVVETNPHVIRKITPAGDVTTFAGTKNNSGSDDGTGTAAKFNYPYNAEFDSEDNLYVADRNNHSIRKITSAGVVTTFAGTGSAGSNDGTGTAAAFNKPYDVAVDSAGNVYVAEQSSHTVRKITPEAVVTTLAGSAGAPGDANGDGSSARFSQPFGIAVNGTGLVYVSDTGNHRIRTITLPTTSLSGTPGNDDTGDVEVCLVATDASGASAERCFTITVAAVNDAPSVATNTGVTLNEGATAHISSSELSASDADDSGAGLTYTVTTVPVHGVLFVDANNNHSRDNGEDVAQSGTFTQQTIEDGDLFYSHDGGETTSDSFVFSIADGGEDAASAVTGQTFSFTVSAVNDAPVITSNGGGTTASTSINENTTAVTTVAATDVDAADTLTYSISGGADAGKFSINSSTGTLTFASAPNFESPTDVGADNVYDVQVTVKDDGTGSLTDAQTIAVTVNNVNENPVITSDGGGAAATVNAAEGQTAVTTVIASDEDASDSLTFSITGGADQALFTINSSTGELTFLSAPSFDNPTDSGHNGVYEVQVTVTDNGTGTLLDVQAIAVTVTDSVTPTLTASSPADDAVGVANNADLVLTFSEKISASTGTIGVYDAADDSLFESFSSANASISGSVATLSPSSAFTPTHSYYVQISSDAFVDLADNAFAGFTDKTTLNFTVENHLPVASADGVTTNEDNAVQVQVLANDSDSDSALNAASVQVVKAPAHGKTSVNTGTGVITYTPAADFNGSDSFSYTVDDVHGGTSNLATVGVTVNAVNDAPVATADLVSTPEDTQAAIDVAANDTDIDTGDAVDTTTIAIVTQPSNGSAAVHAGKIDYTPSANFTGSDSFTYTIDDQNGATSNTATVVINVTGVNDLPTASDDSASVDEDSSVDINVLDNDSDIDGTIDPATVQIMTDAAKGSTSVDAVDGTVTYTPEADFNGSDSFTYVVKDDASGTSNVATVTLTVNSINDAPVAAADTATLQEDTPHKINVLGNDSDIDGTLDATSVQIVTAAEQGSTLINATTGAITYTPDSDFNGSDSLTYRVRDNDGTWSAIATVTLTVEAVNDAPLANDDSVSTDEDTAVIINLLSNDSDVDDGFDTAGIHIVTQPASGSVSVNGDGTVTYTPDADVNGSDSFTYTVDDLSAATSNAATVSITIAAVNDAPSVSGTPAGSVNEDSAYSFTPTVTDPDNDAISLSVTNLPSWASFDNLTGEISGTPSNADIGTVTGIVISASDGQDSTDLAAFSITVNNTNDAPSISGSAGANAMVGELYSFTPTASDPDVDDTLTFSATGLPSWLSLNSTTGQVSGTPSDAHVGSTGSITLSVSDGEASDSLTAFSIAVMPSVDTDGDTLSDYQEGLDGTDANDPEDYLDLVAPELLPPADVMLDATALFTPVSLEQLLSLQSGTDNATLAQVLGALTTDNVDGDACCDPAVEGMTNNVILLPPGRNEVHWNAEDRKGNSARVTQFVYLRPLVSISKNQSVAEGSTVTVSVILNGESPFYPLTVPYLIDTSSTADSADHNLVDGSVTFTESDGVGQTRATISIAIVDDGVAEGDETLIVRLDDRTSNAEDLANGYDENNPDIHDINSGARTRHEILIVERNLAPELALQLQQDGASTMLVNQDGGTVTGTVVVTDPNTGDTHSYDWSASDNVLVDTDGDVADQSLVFDPNGLAAGRYRVSVTVTDSAGARAISSRYFRVVEALPVLSDTTDSDGDGVDDQSEGTGDHDDDGIPDYLDNIVATNVIPEEAGETQSFLMECDPGVRCRLGQFALLGQSGGTRLGDGDFGDQPELIDDEAFEPVSGIFDFEVHELPEFGQSVSIVIPQRVAIPADAVYRKFHNGEWKTFVEDANNTLHSAQGNLGYCPPPGDEAWEEGLVEGYYCVQLGIEDGGVNDADGEVNGSVNDPGAVSVARVTPTIRSSGSGGAIDHWLVGLLSGLWVWRRIHCARRKPSRNALGKAAAVLMLPLAAAVSTVPQNAQALDWQGRVNVDFGVFNVDDSRSATDFTSSMASDGVSVNLNRYGTSRPALQLSVGYQFNKWAAVQVGYLDLGEVKVDFDADAVNNATIEAALENHYPARAEGVTITYRYEKKATEQLSFLFDAGFYFWQGDIDVSGASLSPDGGSGTDLLLGVGATYRFFDHFGAGLRVQRFSMDQESITLAGLVLSAYF